MNSKKLINQLIKKYGTAYAVHKNTKIERWKISKIINKGQYFSPDELLLLIKSGDITKTEAKNIHFYDGMKEKKNFKLVASILVGMGSLQIMSQVSSVYDQLCILC